MVNVSDVKHQRLVYIIGAVVKPGAVELVTQEKVSLLKLLAVAGGFTNLSAKDGTFVRHPLPGGGEGKATKVTVSKILKGQSPDIQLEEGDLVVVPSSRVATYMQTLPQSALTTGLLMLGRF